MHIILKLNCLCFIQLLKSHYVLQCSSLIHLYWLSMAAAYSRSHLTDQCTAAMATVSIPFFSFALHVGVQTPRISFTDTIYWLLDLLFCFLPSSSFWAMLFTFNISFLPRWYWWGCSEMAKNCTTETVRGQKKCLFSRFALSCPFCWVIINPYSPIKKKKLCQFVKVRRSVCTNIKEKAHLTLKLSIVCMHYCDLTVEPQQNCSTWLLIGIYFSC